MSHPISMLAVLVWLGACAERFDQEPTLLPAAREMSPEERHRLEPLSRTHQALTNARCDRQARCGAVGEDRRFATRPECVTHFDWLGYKELRLHLCRTEVNENDLAGCLYAVRSEPCGSTLEVQNMENACRPSRICGAWLETDWQERWFESDGRR